MARRFRAARETGRAIFTKAEQYFANSVEAGFDFAFDVDSGLGFDPSLYDVTLTPEERLERASTATALPPN